MSDFRRERLAFDIFGRTIQAMRTDGKRYLYQVGAEGKKRPMTDVAVPPDLTADELAGFLDELYHERASPAHPSVRLI